MARVPNNATAAPRLATVYVRVSSTRQREEGESMAAQEAACRSFAASKGWTVGQVHVDGGKSGRSTAGRDGLESALSDVCASKGVLLFTRLDRVARSTADAIRIAGRVQGCGADMVSLHESIDTSTPMGAFVYSLLAALGQLESDTAGQRTRSVLGHLRAEGRQYSRRIPFGYTLEGDRLRPCPAEQRTVRAMKRLSGEGKGFRAVASALNEHGHTRRDGSPWRWESVRDVLGAKARELDTSRRREATHAR